MLAMNFYFYLPSKFGLSFISLSLLNLFVGSENNLGSYFWLRSAAIGGYLAAIPGSCPNLIGSSGLGISGLNFICVSGGNLLAALNLICGSNADRVPSSCLLFVSDKSKPHLLSVLISFASLMSPVASALLSFPPIMLLLSLLVSIGSSPGSFLITIDTFFPVYSLLFSVAIGAFDSFLIFATVDIISCSFDVNELSCCAGSTFSIGLRSPVGATAAALAIVDVVIEGVTVRKKQFNISEKKRFY